MVFNVRPPCGLLPGGSCANINGLRLNATADMMIVCCMSHVYASKVETLCWFSHRMTLLMTISAMTISSCIQRPNTPNLLEANRYQFTLLIGYLKHT